MAINIFTIFLVLFLSACSSTKHIPNSTIDELFRDYYAPNAPGAALLVIHDGTVLHNKSYGFAHLEMHRLVTGTTNFRLASVTKQFTAMCILILNERGKLSLDDTLEKFFPEIAQSYRDIKLRYLLNHTSGLPDYENYVPDSQTVQVLDADALRLINYADTVYFPAGSKFSYSNTGYALLALIIEKASGVSFAEFLRQNVFLPLQMNNTVAREAHTVVSDRAYGYTRTDSGWTFADQSSTSAVLGDGGIYSSINDLARWDQSLYTERLLPRSVLETAMSATTPTDTSAYSYGYGWYIGSRHNMKTVFHTGSSRGFRNAIVRIPDERFTVVILTNRNEGNPVEIAYKLIDMYFGR
ncbi:MAG: beta-lactamase family protein [Ignavibacteriae bacterium]|nr:beta-lactamase family protein [Ignavibacteriota bacterium]